eukprot:Nitzschia sp. Nitz4//scaffold241_size29735//8936//10708//NITZ4_008025-RA/size29735-processed-gene-0.1-mRNA-1//1//CDS//3329543772//8776//frame0
MATMMISSSDLTTSDTGSLRPRKYSEGCREIAAVDSHIPSNYDLMYSDSGNNSVTSLEDIDELGEGHSSSDPAKEDCSVASESSCLDASVCDADSPSRRRSSAFLKSLPVAEAMPESLLPLNEDSVEAVMPVATALRLDASDSLDEERASLICVKVFKKDEHAKLGIRLQVSSDGMLRVGQLTGMLGDECPLQPGDELLRINTQNVMAWTITKALKYMRECTGWVTIVVRTPQAVRDADRDFTLCQASVCKRCESDKLGIGFVRAHNEDGGRTLQVRHLNVAGILGGQATIRVGDAIESVNQIPASALDATTAVNVLRASTDWAHVVVRTNNQAAFEVASQRPALSADHEFDLDVHSSHLYDAAKTSQTNFHVAKELVPALDMDGRDNYAEAALVSVTIPRAADMEPLGITLVKVDNVMYIQKLSGYLANSVLMEGMSLVSINERLCCRMSTREAHAVLKDLASLPPRRAVMCLHGIIRLVARNAQGNPQYIQSMVYKRKQATTICDANNIVGVSFKGSTGRQLRICELRRDGLFVHSCLKIGDNVVSVNGTPCEWSRPREAVELVRSSMESVTILAKVKSNTAVVTARV